tara:strand:- start:1326 stop:1925 length:600 start_codon:yes stop_codon:yes gene_type:complete
MVWWHEEKLIFIHIPKTGGSTIQYSLNLTEGMHGCCTIKNAALQHCNWNDYKKLLGNEIYDNYFKFSIVRNPIERCISEYYWTPLNFGYNNKASFDQFLTEVEDIVKNERFFDSQYHDHFQSQSYYILDDDNKVMVDKIFRFENYLEVTKFLNKYTKEKIRKHNAISSKIKKLKPTKEQIEKIYQIYKEDFENFNYKKV